MLTAAHFMSSQTATPLPSSPIPSTSFQARHTHPHTSCSASALPSSAMTSDRHKIQSGLLPSALSRREKFKRPPTSLLASGSGVGTGSSPDDVAARLYRQRFRQRCQAAMAREKYRSGAIAAVRGNVTGGNATNSDEDEDVDDEESVLVLNSDDLNWSDVEPGWRQEDDELVRRVMLAEYKRILQSQESSGQHELGWLGADEVAWLEEELQSESNDRDVEPDEDVVDEDEELFQQYIHAMQQQQQQQASHSQDDEFAYLDDSVFEHLDDDGATSGDVAMDTT